MATGVLDIHQAIAEGIVQELSKNWKARAIRLHGRWVIELYISKSSNLKVTLARIVLCPEFISVLVYGSSTHRYFQYDDRELVNGIDRYLDETLTKLYD